ncbi:MULTISPECIES: aminotransferase class I/II-fold pyridoxal phosphate-dependent enzyme [Pontibacillus]|uniref:Aminotransferase n=1 Tax=Pontibacillus chungwhensis TaxID=265426 RepID=A0ABY8V5A6_9BACI|nr:MULTISPECIES: aminotransferase class I/II-fold pyridoxal phosphate-dependent enzyme [Pontibacillus]MCD5322857.1 aminotransferase class I/II-fold pyridoxal phosphate-dependent enzyme [Pontibacillus sp. HN14]WIG00187.1 aminotransferase class I/II-fold pyridoxal phosphate-dependent enzyme [Pontibacillus chungwhensis]
MTFASDQVNSLPPYLFSVFYKKKKALEAQGVDVIDLGIGAPDLETPSFIIDRMTEEVRKPENHKYSPYSGIMEFKQAVASFYKRYHGVSLNPETEILTLIGSKEGLANVIRSVVNPGDGVLLPDPGYPVYQSAVHLAYGKTIPLPLNPADGYAPMYEKLSRDDLRKAKMMLLNYPGNPTGATAEYSTFSKALTFSEEHSLCLVHDAAYSLVTFGSYKAPSLLQVPGAKEQGLEFGSLSKSFNMTGWRIGYVAGNKDLIQAMSVIKSNTDTSQFIPIQQAGATALNSDLSTVRANNRTYEQRLENLLPVLKELNIEAEKPRGTFFVWAKVPKGYTSESFAEKLLTDAGVIVTPGHAFGVRGEGYFRISLCVPTDRLYEAVQRMKSLSWEVEG